MRKESSSSHHHIFSSSSTTSFRTLFNQSKLTNYVSIHLSKHFTALGQEMSNKNKTNNKSLCEKSMKMMVNIIRLSSLSIAKTSLGTPNSVPTTRSLSSTNIVGVEEPLLPHIPGGRRSQEPRGSSRPIKVVMPTAGEENNNSTSTYVVHREEKKSGVDGWADDYIRKVHEKNRKNVNESSNHDLFIIPPPPTILK